jgi:hypothetical protein
MSIQKYPAQFEDARGVEDTSIYNDGVNMWMTVRGFTLRGQDFDGFSPPETELEASRQHFSVHQGDICSYRLSWTMPLGVLVAGRALDASLSATLVLGAPLPNGGVDAESLQLELELPGRTLRSGGTSGWFEDELLDLVRQLGDPHGIRSCITCAYSDYSPYGHGLFGSLACFRDSKAAYLAVRNKFDLFSIWGQMTDFVQETYLCEQYAPRPNGTGYRG